MTGLFSVLPKAEAMLNIKAYVNEWLVTALAHIHTAVFI